MLAGGAGRGCGVRIRSATQRNARDAAPRGGGGGARGCVGFKPTRPAPPPGACARHLRRACVSPNPGHPSKGRRRLRLGDSAAALLRPPCSARTHGHVIVAVRLPRLRPSTRRRRLAASGPHTGALPALAQAPLVSAASALLPAACCLPFAAAPLTPSPGRQQHHTTGRHPGVDDR